MKYNILISGVLAILLSSCQNTLELAPETLVTPSNFYKSQQDFEQAVGGIYSPLQDIYEQDWILTEMRSDNTHFIFDVANRGSKPEEDPANFVEESNNRNVTDKWSDNYLIISRANEVLSNIDMVDFDFDTSVRNNLKGQAYFLRALAYFDLVKNFGGVPLFLEPAPSYEGTFLAKSSVTEIYEQIISDANVASGLLPNKGEQDPGRATSGASYVLLADTYITLGRWEEAENSLLKLTGMGYTLLDNYADIFRPSNWANDEIIFQVEYLAGTSQSLGSEFPYRFLPVLTDPSIITGVSPANQNDNGSFNTPTPDLLSAYEDPVIDERYEASIGFYSGESPLVGVTYDNSPYIKKYQHPHSLYGETDQNWPVYRYAEVFLMLAESLNEQGKSAEALVYLNQIRNRAGLDNIITTDQSALRDIILNERRIELAFEDKRWHDLVRTGRAVTVMNAYGTKVKNNPQEYYYPVGSQPFANSYEVTEDNYLYPIPITDININPELEQNPGY